MLVDLKNPAARAGRVSVNNRNWLLFSTLVPFASDEEEKNEKSGDIPPPSLCVSMCVACRAHCQCACVCSAVRNDEIDTSSYVILVLGLFYFPPSHALLLFSLLHVFLQMV